MWFDDTANLGPLIEVHDASSAVQFVFSGRAGPTGRPLALASFVSQAYAWPDALDVFLRTNILIHLLNGVLVIWLLYLLGMARGQSERQAALVGAASGAIWMTLPILASSSLFIVQRMTTLSALFVLSGGIAYLYARRRIEGRPLIALFAMTIALGMGTVLGALAKENAALLVVFLLVTEVALLHRPASIAHNLWRSWFAVVLLVPAVILLVYLATRLPYPDTVVLRRDFNGLERLLTQAGILWKYLFLAYVPNLPSLGPFHDDYQVQRSILSWATILPIAGWIAVVSAAILLRRRAPLFTFAAMWFLAGHSLESTTFPLELYFEHRNYLPLIGPTYAGIAYAFDVREPWRRLVMTATAAYGLILAGVMFSVTSLWGNPAVAVEMWYIYKPQSIRAAEVLAQQMEKVGSPDVAVKVFREVREKVPDAHHLDLQILLISCQIEPERDHRATIGLLENKFRTTAFTNSVLGLLWGLDYLYKVGRCPDLPRDAVERLSQSLLDNPRFNIGQVRSNLHVFLAQAAIESGDPERGLEHGRRAFELFPTAQTLTAVVQVLDQAGWQQVAEQFIGEASARTPDNPVQAMLLAKAIEKLESERPAGAFPLDNSRERYR